MAGRPVEQIRAMRQGNIGRLFLRGHRAFSTRATAKLRERGHGELTLAHTVLLANVDVEGTGITSLATRAGITKQSTGQLVTELENAGYVERIGDPHDKRAVIIKFTDQGWKFLNDAYEVKVELDDEYAGILGKERLQELYKLLAELVEQIDSFKHDGE